MALDRYELFLSAQITSDDISVVELTSFKLKPYSATRHFQSFDYWHGLRMVYPGRFAPLGRITTICKTSRGGTFSTGYLLRLAKFAQEKCGDDNTSSSQVQHFPSIREKRKEDCLEDKLHPS